MPENKWMSVNLLRCEALCKSFDGVCALADVSIEFPRASIVAIIGPNGAGKTTLLNTITGFLRPDSGRCCLGDRDITRLAPHRIACLGIARTFQDLRLVQKISVLDNVMLATPGQRGEKLLPALFGVRTRRDEGRVREEARRWLRFVGLESEASALAGEISYGQQKLLTLACCLAMRAPILFLDEPVAGVHPELATKILDLLSKLRDEDRLVVFIEHDLEAVRQIADRVIVMDEGRIIADGAPAEVLARPEIMEAYVA